MYLYKKKDYESAVRILKQTLDIGVSDSFARRPEICSQKQERRWGNNRSVGSERSSTWCMCGERPNIGIHLTRLLRRLAGVGGNNRVKMFRAYPAEMPGVSPLLREAGGANSLIPVICLASTCEVCTTRRKGRTTHRALDEDCSGRRTYAFTNLQDKGPLPPCVQAWGDS